MATSPPSERIALLTADFGGRDSIQPRPPPGLDAFRVSDRGEAEGWATKLIEPPPDPRMAARYVKTHPQRYVPPGYDFILWTDGSIQITDPAFAHWAADHLVGPRQILAAPAHPERDCIYEEATAAATLARYDTAGARPALAAQIAGYRARDFPAHGGLWATPVMLWRVSGLADSVGRSWYGHVVTGSESDQLALPVVMALRHLRVATLELDLMDNPYFVWSPHAS